MTCENQQSARGSCAANAETDSYPLVSYAALSTSACCCCMGTLACRSLLQAHTFDEADSVSLVHRRASNWLAAAMIFLTQGPLDAKKELKQDMIKKCACHH